MELLAPGQHEVRIEVKAIGSTVPNQCGAMISLGYDCAGVVDAVGKNATYFAVP